MFDMIAQFFADIKANRLARQSAERGVEMARQDAMIFQASRGKGFGA